MHLHQFAHSSIADVADQGLKGRRRDAVIGHKVSEVWRVVDAYFTVSIHAPACVMHFRIKGKRDKNWFAPVRTMVLPLTGEYLEAGKHGGAVSHESFDSPLFRPVSNNRTGTLDRHCQGQSRFYSALDNASSSESTDTARAARLVPWKDWLQGPTDTKPEAGSKRSE